VLTTGRPWLWIYVLAAVVMTIAISVFVWLAVESRHDAGTSQAAQTGRIPIERFQLMAQFEPPAFAPGSKPDKSHTRKFQEAMEHYLKKDFAGAVPGLRASTSARADGLEARFYLGICSLLTGDSPGGVQNLQSVVDAGDTPYLEEARYYLAKGLLAKGDIPRARTQLESVIAMHGNLEKQSKSLLTNVVGSAARVN
jgi:TolA-binding protein